MIDISVSEETYIKTLARNSGVTVRQVCTIIVALGECTLLTSIADELKDKAEEILRVELKEDPKPRSL
jgi:hypothetical protein